MPVTFGVLGPVQATRGPGAAVALKGPRHRAVLARLIVARRRVVPVTRLVDDLWADPPPDAVGAVRTFVAALRRALEPERPPRAAPRLLVTDGPGYALLADPGTVDAWSFESALDAAAALPAAAAAPRLAAALGLWRGPAYAEFADEPWAHAERSRLAELRLHAVERLAEARLALGAEPGTIADLTAHVTEHPWREHGWYLLAVALYRTGRQGDALAVLRRARTQLVDRLGLDPGPQLRRLEGDILRQADDLDRRPGSSGPAERVWAEAAAAYDRTVAPGTRSRLDSTVALLRDLAVSGGDGLVAARSHRLAAIAAAEELGDPERVARVIGAYDVPAVWTRLDDPAQAAEVVAAAERALAALPDPAPGAARVRLLATIAVETRGSCSPRARRAALEAEAVARELEDPRLLAFALNGVHMQTFHRTGLAPERDRIGAELVELGARHGLVTSEVLGHLIRVQARSALTDFTAADAHAAAADRLAERHELPLVATFTRWYAVLRRAAAGTTALADLDAAYRCADADLDGAGMPGLRTGLLPLALLCARVARGVPGSVGPDVDWGPYEPWVRPHLLLAAGDRDGAAAALAAAPDPPCDLTAEVLWGLVAEAALTFADRPAMERARRALAPARAELAGAGTGLVALRPVSAYLRELDAALG